MRVNELAGKLAPPTMLVNVPRLVTAHYSNVPDPAVPGQRVAFGTSGHRGSAFDMIARSVWNVERATLEKLVSRNAGLTIAGTTE